MLKSVVALALAGVAIAQSFSINTPPSLIECQPAQITWVGGTPNYILAAIPAGQVSAAAIATIGNDLSGTTFAWTVNLPKGTAISLKLTDKSGNIAYSSPLTIQGGSSTSCLNASAATGGATGGGVAASSASSAVSSVAASASTVLASASSASASISAAASSASGAVSSISASASSASRAIASSASAASSSIVGAVTAAQSSSSSAMSTTTPISAASASASATQSSPAHLSSKVELPAALLAVLGGLAAIF